MIRPAASKASGRICQPISEDLLAASTSVWLASSLAETAKDRSRDRANSTFRSTNAGSASPARSAGRPLTSGRLMRQPSNKDRRTGSDSDTPTGGHSMYPWW